MSTSAFAPTEKNVMSATALTEDEIATLDA